MLILVLLTDMYLCCISLRVRGMHISPEVRNAIHVGDRILEINGLPVGTLMEEEVSCMIQLLTVHWIIKHWNYSDYSVVTQWCFIKCDYYVSICYCYSKIDFGTCDLCIPFILPSFKHSLAGRGWHLKGLQHTISPHTSLNHVRSNGAFTNYILVPTFPVCNKVHSN